MNNFLSNNTLDTVSNTENVIFRKDTFEVTYPTHQHKETGEISSCDEFEIIKMNLAQNQYRVKYNILFPEEIKQIRIKYKLSATKMSELLGFGVNGYRNYEIGEVPSLSNANLIRLADDPNKFKTLVQISNFLDKEEGEKDSLLETVNFLIKEGENNVFKIEFQDYLMGVNLPDAYSGYVKPNLNKLVQMIAFFSEKFEPYKTQLNKLLFYSDFYNYSYFGTSMSGTRYRAINRGPVPENYDSIFDYAVREGYAEIIETVWANGFSSQFKGGIQSFDKECFTEIELEILENVVDAFEGKSTKQIVDISHEELAWIENYNDGKSLIDYKYAFNLKYMS